MNKNLQVFPFLEAAVSRCSSKYVLLKILQNSLESTYDGASVDVVAGLGTGVFVRFL